VDELARVSSAYRLLSVATKAVLLRALRLAFLYLPQEVHR